MALFGLAVPLVQQAPTVYNAVSTAVSDVGQVVGGWFGETEEEQRQAKLADYYRRALAGDLAARQQLLSWSTSMATATGRATALRYYNSLPPLTMGTVLNNPVPGVQVVPTQTSVTPTGPNAPIACDAHDDPGCP